MNRYEAVAFGRYLRQTREDTNTSARSLSARTGVPAPTITRIENGESKNPLREILIAIADGLGLDPAVVLAKAGYGMPPDLLRPTIYLRTKYHHLSEDQLARLENDVNAVLRRHGLDADDSQVGGQV